MSSKSASVPGVIAHAPVVPLRVLFRRFWPYVRPRRRWLPLALVLTLVLPAIEVVDVGLFKVMVDDVLVPRHFELFFRIAMLYLVLALAEAVVSFVADLLSSWLSQRFLLDLRTDVFRHLQTMSLDFYERHRIGDLVSRLTNDIAGIESFLVSGMTAAVSFAVQILLFATVLFVIQWQLALIATVAAPLFWVVAGRFARRIKTASRERRRRSGSLSALAEETLGNAALIQAYNRQDWEVARFHREGEAKYAAEMSGARLSALYTPVVDMIELLGGLCVIGFGAWLITRSELSIGSFLAFLALLSMLYSPIRGLSRLATSAYSASASAERVIEILDERATVASGPAAQVLARPVEVLNVDDVSFAYPGCAEPTLRNVSLQVRRGDVLALVGSSGAGKSTLIKLLLRFYDPDRGCVRLDGVDVRELELTSLRDNVCVVLQETLVFDGTIRDNIAYGRADATEADIVAAARAADAHEFITSLPEGYDTRVGERGRRLSGGQRQRMAIARAMVRDAPVLVLDEPTTGLDAESGERILEPLRRLMSGRATIVISHNLLTAREATEIVVLDRGKVVERGRHPELLRRHGSYARLYQLSGLALDGREHSPDMGPATATAALGGAGAPDVHTVRATPGGLPGSPARLPGQRHRPRRVVSRAAVPTVIADAVGVVGLRAPSGTTTVNTRSTATGPVAPTLDGIWIVPRGSAAGRLALTGRVPRAPGLATLTGSAFDVMVNGQHAPAAVEPVASAWVSLAIVLAAAGDLRRGATDRRSVADGLVELLWQLPAGWSIAVIDSLGRSVQQPATADVTALVPALSIGSTAPAPDSGLRLGAEQVATALAGRRVVVVVGSDTTTYAGRTLVDASLDATTAGTAVYVASDDVLASGQLMAALGYTGGTAYFTAAADKLAADPTDRYRLVVPTPPPTATSAVRLTGIAVGTSSA